MAVPSSSSGSTNEGRRALFWGVAALKTPVAPGRSCRQSERSCLCSACKSSVHIWPSECSPLSRVLARATSWLLDELPRRVVITFARVAGVKYCRALLSSCFLARSSWRDRLAFGAVRAIPPGVCSASPVQISKGCCWSRLMTAISRSMPYCCPSSITISESSCINPPIADHCIVRSWATVPPVASTIWHLLSIVLLSLGCMSNLVCE